MAVKNNGTTESKKLSAAQRYLRGGLAEVQAWCKENPIKVNSTDDNGVKTTKEITRTSVSVSCNLDPELFSAVIEGAAGGQGRPYVTDGDLQYNALNKFVQDAIYAASSAFLPDGFKYESPIIGARSGEGATAKLAVATTQINEFVAMMVPLVRSGAVSLDQVPEASRDAVAALL